MARKVRRYRTATEVHKYPVGSKAFVDFKGEKERLPVIITGHMKNEGFSQPMYWVKTPKNVSSVSAHEDCIFLTMPEIEETGAV